MHLVLQKVIDHGWQSSEKSSGQIPTPFQGLYIITSTRINHTKLPGKRTDQIKTHGNIVREMVVCRRNIHPTAASHGPHDTHKQQEQTEAVRTARIRRPGRVKVPQEHKRKSRSRS